MVFADASTERPFPDIPGFLTVTGDFHQHTVFSDGRVLPGVRVDEATRDRLDVLAISDHLEWQPHQDDVPNPDQNRGYELAMLAASSPTGMSEGDYWILQRRAAGDEESIRAQTALEVKPPDSASAPPARDLLVIRAAEVTRNAPFADQPTLGHVTALFLKDINRLNLADPVDVLREMAAQDGFGIWNHPWRSGGNTDQVARLTPFHSDLMAKGLIEGIEIVNETSYSREAHRIAVERDLAVVSGSDIHGLIAWEYPQASGRSRPRTLMFCTDVTEAGVRGALRGRRTAVWANGTLIGPAPYLVPLLAACLTVESAAYQPDTRRFALQQRDPTPLLDCVLGNRGPLPLIIRMSGEVGPVSHPGPITVPARGTTRVRLQTYRRSTGVTVEVEALNALVAPDEPARFTLRIPPTDT